MCKKALAREPFCMSVFAYILLLDIFTGQNLLVTSVID